MEDELDNPNELMAGIEDIIGTKLDWGQNNVGIILPLESLQTIYRYAENASAVSFKQKLENGAASMRLDLSDGVITVRHGTDNSVLFSSEVALGTWDEIWETIRKGEV